MENWKLEAELSKIFGSLEWITATLKTLGKEYKFASCDIDLAKSTQTPVPINLEPILEVIESVESVVIL